MKCQFDGTREIGSAPRHFSGQQVYDQVVEDTTPKVDSESTVLRKQKCSAKAKSVVKKWWKKMSILWELPYWKDNGPPQHRSHAREKECLWEFAWDTHELQMKNQGPCKSMS